MLEKRKIANKVFIENSFYRVRIIRGIICYPNGYCRREMVANRLRGHRGL